VGKYRRWYGGEGLRSGLRVSVSFDFTIAFITCFHFFILKVLVAVMGSRDLVSVPRLASRPIFASLCLSLEGYRSRLGLEGYRGLETLNIAKKWLSKTSIIQRFLFIAFAGKKQPKQVGNMPET